MDNQLTVKEIEFNGDKLIAAQENGTDKVYVAVRWVVDGIGFTRGQSNNQLEKIHDDIVLKQGVRNLVFQNMGKGGTQEVLCIELDFLPLWLAKISITPKMQESNPVLVEKLVGYQLKAKDVLAKAFIKNEFKLPMTYKEALLQLIEREEENERLRLESQENKPKVEAHSHFLDAHGGQTISDVAKALDVKPKKFFQFLRSEKFLFKRGKKNLPYQQYLDDGIFIVTEKTVGEETDTLHD